MTLARSLQDRIAAEGPLRLDDWMAACNAAYYAGIDPLGRDFTTAPEVSQMFGEMIGGWVGDLWLRAGRPAFHLVELGPGRGTLLADALRVLARLPGLADAVQLHLVETSLPLRSRQHARLAGWPAHWHARVDQLPNDRPLIIIANEFFDALPIRQRRDGRELFVGHDSGAFAPLWRDSPGDDAEWSEAGIAIAGHLVALIAGQGGAALIIDYGHGGDSTPHDTLQAVHAGQRASPFANPGAHDLTALVDFAAIARQAHGLAVHGPLAQGAFLNALGLAARAGALKAGKRHADAAAITAAQLRLTAPQQMGAIFQALALAARHWPAPAGFAMERP